MKRGYIQQLIDPLHPSDVHKLRMERIEELFLLSLSVWSVEVEWSSQIESIRIRSQIDSFKLDL